MSKWKDLSLQLLYKIWTKRSQPSLQIMKGSVKSVRSLMKYPRRTRCWPSKEKILNGAKTTISLISKTKEGNNNKGTKPLRNKFKERRKLFNNKMLSWKNTFAHILNSSQRKNQSPRKKLKSKTQQSTKEINLQQLSKEKNKVASQPSMLLKKRLKNPREAKRRKRLLKVILWRKKWRKK